MGQPWCFHGASLSSHHWQLGSSGVWHNVAEGNEDAEWGSSGSLARTPFAGKIVWGPAVETTLDDSALAVSMLGDKFFTSSLLVSCTGPRALGGAGERIRRRSCQAFVRAFLFYSLVMSLNSITRPGYQ